MNLPIALPALGLGALLSLAGETRRLLRLEQFPPLPPQRLPALSIVVAARDEAATVGPAVASLLDLGYPDLEIVFVDDRSTDGTAEAVRRVAEGHPRGHRLHLLENRELPDGWLGKVHALHLGARACRHDLVLLTDADVIFAPEALRRAVTAQQVLGADHLAVLPRVEVRGFWEPTLVAFLASIFMVLFRPASLHRSRYRFLGVGAFTLLTRSMLEQLGGLEPLQLQVVDDGFLGMMVKARGGRQFVLMGQEQMSLRWFHGLGGLVRGLEKNAYAATGYRPLLAVLSALATSSLLWLPLLVSGLGSPLWGALLYLFFALDGLLVARASRAPLWPALTHPRAGGDSGSARRRAAGRAEPRKAVVWRGTAYPLATLREAHHAFFKAEWARLRSL